MKSKSLKLISAIAAISMVLCGCSPDSSSTASTTPEQKSPSTSTSVSTSAIVTATTASEEITQGESEAATAEPTNAVVSIDNGRGTMLSLKDNGELDIQRLAKSAANSDDADMWTVFVYMCGSDLESIDGSATDDMIEMQDATENCENLRFVIEADGAAEWWNDMCIDGQKQRLLISGGYCDVVDSGESSNMGDPDTLEEFLKWGLEEYGSGHTVLDLWNHGGGSISGVCFDENFDDDSLSLEEIDMALANVYSETGFNGFELIGCDACLMATVELANILASYSNYMVGSQELESGYGWDYNSFADAVNAGVTNGGELGRYLCDGYYESCIRSEEEDEATLSVIDLNKLDPFLSEFNAYCSDIYDYICTDSGLNDVISAAKSALNYGGNNRSEGYTNMVDLCDFINYTSDFSDKAANAKKLFSDCVVYVKNGSGFNKASGLSTYYPLCVQGSKELEYFKNICVSPYYISIADICAYGSDKNGSIDGYNTDLWLNGDAGYWSANAIDVSDFDYWEEDIFSGLNSDSNNTALSYEIEPNVDEDGSYNFTLTQDSLYNLDTVYCSVMLSYWDDEDNCEYMLDLGTDDYVDFDWETGKCMDLFDGLWFALPDGQPICAYLVETVDTDTEYYNVYTAPIYLNDEYTNLRIKQTYGAETITEVLGVWDGISESGSVSRDIYQLKDGDRIEPCYLAYNAETLEYAFDFYGNAYVCEGELMIDYDYLYDGDYYYSFEIYDYYGNALYTDFVLFGIETTEEGVQLYYY